MTGNRFSQIYLERGNPTKDSERLRVRLSGYIWNHLRSYESGLTDLLRLEVGVNVSNFGSLSSFVHKGQMRDVLDSITFLFALARIDGEELEAQDWKTFVARAFREENVGYRLDDECVVHYHVDEEFERNRVSALALLDSASLANVRAAFEDAYRHLDSSPPDTKAAVRSIFESVEVLARLIVPEAKNLYRKLAETTLKEKCLVVSGADATEQKTLAGLFDSLGEWVDALHNYRHGQPEAEPVAPSEELAVYALSTGAAHLRMLAGFAAKMAL